MKFDPKQTFASVSQAVALIAAQSAPFDALMATVRANVLAGEFGFASEIVKEFEAVNCNPQAEKAARKANWVLAQVFENYVDFDRELTEFEDTGNSSVQMRLTFDTDVHRAYVTVTEHNENGLTVELLPNCIHVLWEEGIAMLGETPLPSELKARPQDRTHLLKDWVLRYGGGAQLFLCQAEDLSHAVEQCHSAYPNEAVVSAQLNEIVLTTVQCWDSPLYKGDGPETDATYDINIVDRRRTSGQLSIDFERQGSQVEDNMIINLEVNRLPDDINPVQCLHLGFDADSIAMSVFKMGDRYILRPEADTELSLTPLPNGEYAYALVRCNAHEPLKVPDGAATGEDEFGPQDNEQHGSATEHGTESTRVRLTLDVDYDLHGLSIEEMQRRLCQMVERAIGQGMLTGQSGATVDQYSMETEVLLLEPV